MIKLRRVHEEGWDVGWGGKEVTQGGQGKEACPVKEKRISTTFKEYDQKGYITTK